MKTLIEITFTEGDVSDPSCQSWVFQIKYHYIVPLQVGNKVLTGPFLTQVNSVTLAVPEDLLMILTDPILISRDIIETVTKLMVKEGWKLT
jgi:hypothetical protein